MGFLLIWCMIRSSHYVHGAMYFSERSNDSKCSMEIFDVNLTLSPGAPITVGPCLTVNKKAPYPDCCPKSCEETAV
ncbi:unnamed protein product [Gordionus sp. m RMFG-2023]